MNDNFQAKSFLGLFERSSSVFENILILNEETPKCNLRKHPMNNRFKLLSYNWGFLIPNTPERILIYHPWIDYSYEFSIKPGKGAVNDIQIKYV